MLELMKATKELEDYRISLKNKRIKELEDEKEIIITNSLTITDSRKVINAIVRKICASTHRNYSEVWSELYKKLNYKLSISINNRQGKGSKLDRLTEQEMYECEKICRSWATELGLDVEKIIKLQ